VTPVTCIGRSTGKRPANWRSSNFDILFLSSPLTQFHASAFYSLYNLTKTAFPEALLGELLIEAFCSYCEFTILLTTIPTCLILIAHSFLFRPSKPGPRFRQCSECHSHYIGAHRYLDGQCPICASIRRERCSACGSKYNSFVLYPKPQGWPLLNGLPNLPRIRNQTQASKNQQLCFQPYRGCNIQRNVLINARLQNQKAAGLPFLLMQTEAEHQFEHSTC